MVPKTTFKRKNQTTMTASQTSKNCKTKKRKQKLILRNFWTSRCGKRFKSSRLPTLTLKTSYSWNPVILFKKWSPLSASSICQIAIIWTFKSKKTTSIVWEQRTTNWLTVRRRSNRWLLIRSLWILSSTQKDPTQPTTRRNCHRLKTIARRLSISSLNGRSTRWVVSSKNRSQRPLSLANTSTSTSSEPAWS